MIEWIKNMLSSTSDQSIKRLSIFVIIAALIILAFIATYTIHRCPQEMYDTLAWLCAAVLAGNVVEKFKKKNTQDTQGE